MKNKEGWCKVKISMTIQEREALKKKARLADLDMTNYVRRILGYPYRDPFRWHEDREQGK